jgi:hypothetical protein
LIPTDVNIYRRRDEPDTKYQLSIFRILLGSVQVKE